MEADLVASQRSPRLHLDIVVWHDGTNWIGHCIQLDLVTSALDRERVFINAQKVCLAQLLYALEHDTLGNVFRPWNPALVEIMLRAQSDGELEVRIEPVRIGEHDVEFQGIFTAPATAAA